MPKSHAIAIAVLADAANEEAFELRRGIPRIVLSVDAAVHDFRVHARAADRLPDFVEHQDVEIERNASHP